MLENFLRRNKFKQDGKLYYGVYNNRTISIVPLSSFVKVSITFNRPLDREQGQACSLKLRELKSTSTIIQQAIVSNVSMELFLYQSNDLEEKIDGVLTKTVAIVDQFQNVGIETCPICGQVLTTDCPFIRIRDTVLQAHEHCIVQLEGASTNAVKAMNQGEKNVGKTLLCAFIAFTGITALMFLLGFAGIFGYIGFISGWASILLLNYLLKKMKVKSTTFSMIVIIVVSLLTLFASVYLGSVADIYNTLKEQYTLGTIFNNFFDILINNPNYTKFVIVDLVLGVLMNGFSYYATIRRIIGLHHNAIKRL